MKTYLLMFEHEVMDFQVEEILGECIGNPKPNGYHYYVEIDGYFVTLHSRRHHWCGLMWQPKKFPNYGY